jgi:dTDP-glucose 4,6-dehydratase
MQKNVFVTGADGFIGSHLVEALAAAGHHVRALVLYNSFGGRGWLDQVDARTLDSIEVIAGDVRDALRVRQAMRGCDAVMHLAALIGIPYSYVAAQSYVDTNVSGTLNVLQAAHELGVGSFIHTSTSEVYGSAQQVPIDEQHRLLAQSPYAATKIAADQLALAYHASFGLPVVVLRPFNTYGPRQSARAVIPAVISQLAANTPAVKLGSLEPTRDFNFVADTVGAFCAALDCTQYGEVINIGSGFEIAIGDIARMIADVMQKDAPIVCDPARVRPAASEVQRLVADAGKARRVLAYSPRYAGRDGLKRGLEATIDWFTQPANLAWYRSNDYLI